MITTLTPNPSLDRTVSVDELIPGAIHRSPMATVEAGGKGVNVARALTANGHEARAIIPAGGSTGALMEELLVNVSVPVTTVETGRDIRTNISVIEANGQTTKLNETGHQLAPEQVEALFSATIDAAKSSTWIAACGSLPPGAPVDFYAELVRRIDGATKVVIDTSGPALNAMVGSPCSLLKPNRSELAEATGQTVETMGQAINAAEHLRSMGTEAILVSLGSDGAVLVNAEGAFHGVAAPTEVRNTVGAGDALLSGFLAGGGAGEAGLREALAWARATVRSATTLMAGPADEDYASITITPVPNADAAAAIELKDMT